MINLLYRICGRCKVWADHGTNSARKGGLSSHCRVCAKEFYYIHRDKRLKEKSDKWFKDVDKSRKDHNNKYHTNKSSIRDKYLLRTYGISLSDFNKLKDMQKDACAICHIIPTESLCVDHNHDTGEVRGLLCKPCNVGLGNFRDDPVKLTNASNYLKLRGDYKF
jgi:hypothetical protein